MELQAAISKVDRYSSAEQGDKVEVIERPRGGISIIMAEGKLSGRRSRSIAMKAVHSILNLIASGLHDGAASRTVLTNIYEEHNGKAKVSLSIISCDLDSQSIVITKNNTTPVVTVFEGTVDYLRFDVTNDSDPSVVPSVYQFEIEKGRDFILVSDGILQAGTQNEQSLDLRSSVESLFEDDEPTVQDIADAILTQAVSQDLGRPHDDMTVTVLRISSAPSTNIRRECVHFPIFDPK
jgi:serine/threonine protein phosphatase PrpC